jgi:hypothetical protein
MIMHAMHGFENEAFFEKVVTAERFAGAQPRLAHVGTDVQMRDVGRMLDTNFEIEECRRVAILPLQ